MALQFRMNLLFGVFCALSWSSQSFGGGSFGGGSVGESIYLSQCPRSETKFCKTFRPWQDSRTENDSRTALFLASSLFIPPPPFKSSSLPENPITTLCAADRRNSTAQRPRDKPYRKLPSTWATELHSMLYQSRRCELHPSRWQRGHDAK
jgi:hypothetical protein